MSDPMDGATSSGFSVIYTSAGWEGANPLVSVLMLCYQNAPYIAAAMEGLVAQRCDFEWELLIGDDCSTDDSLKLVLDACPEFSGPVRVLRGDRNVGMHRNYQRLLSRARGNYIANLDGDDSWSDPHKLQKQVRVLEGDLGVSMVYGRSEVRNSLGDRLYWRNYEGPSSETSFEELFVSCDIPHSTIIFRRECFPSLYDWMYLLPNYDWSLMLVLAKQGRLIGLPDVLGVYNWHGTGSASSRSAVKHLQTNHLHLAMHSKIFNAGKGTELAQQALQKFGYGVSGVLRGQARWRDAGHAVYLYLRTAVKLRILPRWRWLAGETLCWLRG